MVDLARPNFARPIAVMFLSSPVIGLFAWVGLDVMRDSGFGENVFLCLIFCMAAFPFLRSMHALASRPHLRANREMLEIRYWNARMRLFIPLHLYAVQRIPWKEITGVREQRISYSLLFVEHYAFINSVGRKPVCIATGMFDKPADQIAQMIRNRLAANTLRAVVPERLASPHAKRLSQEFAEPVILQFTPRRLRLAGLLIGPPLAIGLAVWVLGHIDDYGTPEELGGVVFAVAVGWVIVALEELARWIRFRRRRFWLRRDGIAIGEDEVTARVTPWTDVLGARRRVKRVLDMHDRPSSPTRDGMDILLRDGGSLWIPELYSKTLDQLVGLLHPHSAEMESLEGVVDQIGAVDAESKS